MIARVAKLPRKMRTGYDSEVESIRLCEDLRSVQSKKKKKKEQKNV